jgi:hypothetical protein
MEAFPMRSSPNGSQLIGRPPRQLGRFADEQSRAAPEARPANLLTLKESVVPRD